MDDHCGPCMPRDTIPPLPRVFRKFTESCKVFEPKRMFAYVIRRLLSKSHWETFHEGC